MTELCRLTVPVDPARLSTNSRVHWTTRWQRSKQARARARAAWLAAGSPQASGPVRADFLVRRGRRMDPDNALSGLKGVIDGLFVGAITPTDDARWLTLGPVTQETGARWRGHEHVIVTVWLLSP